MVGSKRTLSWASDAGQCFMEEGVFNCGKCCWRVKQNDDWELTAGSSKVKAPLTLIRIVLLWLSMERA